MLGLFLLFSMTIWFLVDILKQNIKLLNLPDTIYNVVVWAVALIVGMLISFQFRLDAFVLAHEVMKGFIPIEIIELSITGQVFGGLLLASGSGGVNAFLKALRGLKPPIDEQPADEE